MNTQQTLLMRWYALTKREHPLPSHGRRELFPSHRVSNQSPWHICEKCMLIAGIEQSAPEETL